MVKFKMPDGTPEEKPQIDPSGFHQCPICGKETSNQRKIITGLMTCVDCAPKVENPKGIMEYGEKAGGVLVICQSEAEFQNLKKPANRRR